MEELLIIMNLLVKNALPEVCFSSSKLAPSMAVYSNSFCVKHILPIPPVFIDDKSDEVTWEHFDDVITQSAGPTITLKPPTACPVRPFLYYVRSAKTLRLKTRAASQTHLSQGGT